MSNTKRLSAGVVVIRQAESGCLYLLLRAYNYWDFPKGLVEENELPMDAARRETLEETGIDELNFAWGDEFFETPPYAAGKVARYYLACAQQTQVVMHVNPEPGRPEHHEYRWVSYAEAQTLLNERLRSVLVWAHELSAC